MKRWQKVEIKDSKTFGSTRRPRSGGFYSMPGDHIDSIFLYDSKSTDKDRFTITKVIWDKIYNEALRSHRLPALAITFLTTGQELTVLSSADFVEIKENAQKYLDLCK